MSMIGDIFNSSKGAGFTGGNANVVQPVKEVQANTAYQTSTDAMRQQQDFLNALQGQNGIGNQSSVFNQQQALANQLGQQAQGGGPNPALAQLNNTTGANVANQAALMAGQRGSNANVGLLARQAAMQGANTQQQAAGQGAALRAQQQLAAQQALQQQQGMMGNLSTQQVGQQAGALNNLNQQAQSEQQLLLNSINAQNQANVGIQSNMNNVNGQIAQGNQSAQTGAVSGLIQGGMMALADGGVVDPKVAFGESLRQALPDFFNAPKPKPNEAEERQKKYEQIRVQNRANMNYADGGPITNGPSSFAGNYLAGTPGAAEQNPFSQAMNENMTSPDQNYKSMKNAGQSTASGIGSMLSKLGSAGGGGMGMSAGEGGLAAGAMAATGGKVQDYTSGGKLPGKAEVKGDSLKNDKVPIMGSPGEIMLPRSVTMHKNAPEKAKQFVAAILAKQSLGKKK